ncbi:gephyrin-like molybdotransferase Glp [Halothece sp. PCC 7418]|uniref:molybdopterin molybdotransferase MoeA n=1 Tax=Halothece sp. (strain PCC 7418) TaxID=65093 RepID=UPI00059F2413|nr:gephyrin-like molybdotransferase Glp [Halothece sp. PCC 7418]
MLPVKDAENLILNTIEPLTETEPVTLDAVAGRILAQAVTSELDYPHEDNSAMDGYAARSRDLSSASPDQPVTLEIIEEIPAGVSPRHPLQTGQAARIFTGGILPLGADTIVMQEDTQKDGNQVKIFSAATVGQFIRKQGSFYQSKQPLLPSGIKISAPEIAVLAAMQCREISVYCPPRVSIFSSGNELVNPEDKLQRGQLVDSNQSALKELVKAQGAVAIPLGIIKDEPDLIKSAIAQAISSSDIVISTGGVSVGDYDYIENILTELGGTIQINSVAIKPGKPLTFATFPNCYYFGLPGNPVSALVTFWRFVAPAIKKLSGQKSNLTPTFVKAKTQQELRSGGKRETYLWGKIEAIAGEYEFHVAGGSYSSGNLINLAQTNALAILPIGTKFISAQETVEVMLIS